MKQDIQRKTAWLEVERKEEQQEQEQEQEQDKGENEDEEDEDEDHLKIAVVSSRSVSVSDFGNANLNRITPLAISRLRSQEKITAAKWIPCIEQSCDGGGDLALGTSQGTMTTTMT